MTMPGAGIPFPGMPGVGATPQQAAAPAQFSLIIQPDANWEPFEATDVLEMDGYYCCRITKESARLDDKPGVWFTLVIEDTDAKGKTLNRFLNDPRVTQKDTWHQWRGLLMSITGDINAGKSGLAYTVGMFVGQLVYVKTGAYTDQKTGAQRTGIDAWAKKTEWEEAYKTNNHRWKPRLKGAGSPGASVGMLPGGLPGGFPPGAGGLPGTAAPPTGGLPTGGGLPGAPSVQGPPTIATTPQPPAAPMQQPAYAPPQAPVAPPQQAYAPTPGFAAPAPVVAPMPPAQPSAPPPAASPFSFAQPPSFAPPNGTATPQPPPTAAGLASSFPIPGQG